MESDRRSNFLFGRIFFDELVSTSSENAPGTGISNGIGFLPISDIGCTGVNGPHLVEGSR
ncbi:MAG: hypothetical protein H6875_13960 [Hyphomicrobiaceae bacterium]|nr:hypothetical protein [Hyphomicrobiaceae bacterium]